MRYLLIILASVLILACSGGDRGTVKEDRPAVPTNEGMEEASKAEEFVMFVYHRFGDPRHITTNISLEDFRRQMEYLKSAGFEVVTLSEAMKTSLPDGKKRAVISVDDSYKSFLTGAMPVLNEYDFPATLFVNTETVGGDDFLTWGQLDSLREAGIEIGNHSHSHSYFLDMPQEVYLENFRQDVTKAQRLFREHLGMEPEVFAYPYGEYDEPMKEVIRNLGFIAGTAQNSGVVLKGLDNFALPRFPVSDAYAELESFKDKANARSFHVLFEYPESPVIGSGEEPVWKFVAEEELQRGRMQCFVQGGFCRMDSSGDTLIVQTEDPLQNRRTLYTITMPDDDGNWFWRSYLWIIPDRE